MKYHGYAVDCEHGTRFKKKILKRIPERILKHATYKIGGV